MSTPPLSDGGGDAGFRQPCWRTIHPRSLVAAGRAVSRGVTEPGHGAGAGRPGTDIAYAATAGGRAPWRGRLVCTAIPYPLVIRGHRSPSRLERMSTQARLGAAAKAHRRRMLGWFAPQIARAGRAFMEWSSSSGRSAVANAQALHVGAMRCGPLAICPGRARRRPRVT